MVKKTYTIQLECEPDGRWLADVVELPGVMAYGPSKPEAIQAVMALALRVLADQVEHGEGGSSEIVQGMFAHA